MRPLGEKDVIFGVMIILQGFALIDAIDDLFEEVPELDVQTPIADRVQEKKETLRKTLNYQLGIGDQNENHG